MKQILYVYTDIICSIKMEVTLHTHLYSATASLT